MEQTITCVFHVPFTLGQSACSTRRAGEVLESFTDWQMLNILDCKHLLDIPATLFIVSLGLREKVRGIDSKRAKKISLIVKELVPENLPPKKMQRRSTLGTVTSLCSA